MDKMDPKPIKCRAAVFWQDGKPMTIEETICPVPDVDQVRIRIAAAGICGSDGHYVFGTLKLPEWGHKLPTVLGHEGSGIVESVGKNITDLKPGDHVLTVGMPQCGKCELCENPRLNQCLTHTWPILGSKSNRKLCKDNSDIYSMIGIGCYAEYITVHRNSVAKIDPDVNLKNSAIISCAVCTGFYSATNIANVRPGSICAIWGLGAVGLNTIQGCRYNNAKHIIGIDMNSSKRPIAEKCGCTEFINPKELLDGNNSKKSLEEYLKEKYPQGIEFTFDCVGHQMIIDQCLKTLSTNGTFTLIGVPKPDTMINNHPAINLLHGQKITGGSFGAVKQEKSFPKLIKLYKEKNLLIDELINKTYKLEQINDAFDDLKQGKLIRSLILFD